MKYGNLTLGQIEAGINKIGGENAFMRLLAGELNVVPAKPTDPKKLLELVATTLVTACEKFVAREHFKIDTKKAAVRIAWIGDNFKVNFLGLSEGACEAAIIKTHKLLRSSRSAPIITELGSNAKIKLGQFFALLQKQGKGEAGTLLVNGYANTAYIRDMKGNLWAVSVFWDFVDGGWYVEAHSVEDPNGLDAGRYVLSC